MLSINLLNLNIVDVFFCATTFVLVDRSRISLSTSKILLDIMKMLNSRFNIAFMLEPGQDKPIGESKSK